MKRLSKLLPLAVNMVVLQLCRSGLICCANAPCVISFRSVQVEAIRTGSHSPGGWLVSAFFLVVPGRDRRADLARRATPRRPGTTRKNADTNHRQKDDFRFELPPLEQTGNR